MALDVLKMGAGGLVAGAMIPARQLGKAFRWVGGGCIGVVAQVRNRALRVWQPSVLGRGLA